MTISPTRPGLVLPKAIGTARPRRARRLPVQKPWPAWRIAGVQVGILILLLLAWEGAADIGMINAFFWSQPSAVFHSLVVFCIEGDAVIDITTTFEETLIGFALGTAIGSIIGLSFWWSRNYAAVAQPFIICFESIPKLALAPLVILVFGMGLASKVAIATALTLVVTTLTVSSGVKAVDPDSERLFYSLGASRWQVFRKLVVPACLPWMISLLRVNIGLALTGAVVGEFIASQHGLGREIFYAGSTYDIALVWVAVLVLSALSILMYLAVSALEKALRRGVLH
jgi:NitT/TauT family transport system permease protein